MRMLRTLLGNPRSCRGYGRQTRPGQSRRAPAEETPRSGRRSPPGCPAAWFGKVARPGGAARARSDAASAARFDIKSHEKDELNTHASERMGVPVVLDVLSRGDGLLARLVGHSQAAG